jgi:excisionase family DNA binding protein
MGVEYGVSDDQRPNRGPTGASEGELSSLQAAAVLGVSERTVRRAIASGWLPATKRAGCYRIAAADVAYYDAHRQRRSRPPTRPDGDRLRVIPFPARERDAVSRLPRSLDTLVGRERELIHLGRLLARRELRLLTLIGPGGVGKTRLAIAAAQAAESDFPDGVDVVPLAPLNDPAMVASSIARAIGVREAADQPLGERLREALGDQHRLLILDNFEHVLAAAPLVAELLRACRRLVVMTTSRGPLRLTGEQVYRVPPLALPEAGGGVDIGDGAAEAVRLFVTRARQADPTFALTPENAPLVADICRRLDGLPLAIELAAARVGLLPPAALLARLDPTLTGSSLRLLEGGPRDAPARLRTMRDAIAWSYDLLAPAEQALFRRLAVFSGGFTLEAAETVAVAAGDLGREVLAGIADLADQSLLRPEVNPVPGEDLEPRFGMLETVRQYALECLKASGEDVMTRDAHAGWMCALAQRAAPQMPGPNQAQWLVRLETEIDNLRGALAWSLEREHTETALRLAATLWLFWMERGLASEGRLWLTRALAAAEDEPTAPRAAALFAAGTLAAAQCEFTAAEAALEAALALWRTLGVAAEVARTLHTLGIAAIMLNENERALHLLEQAIPVYGRPTNLADEQWMILVSAQSALAISRLGDRERAIATERAALERFRALGSELGIGVSLLYLGEIERDWDELTLAATHYRESLAVMWRLGDRWHLRFPLLGLAYLATTLEPPMQATRLLGAVSSVCERLAQPFEPRFQRDQDAAVATTEAALGEAAFAAAWTEGRTWSLEKTVNAAAGVGTRVSGVAAAAGDAMPVAESPSLTMREREVLRLVATGRSNREVAEALYISVPTVKRHLSTILAKLALPSRAAAAAYAHKHGLV